MSKIFYFMGKSASGKDTIFKQIKERMPNLKTIVIYTTRPIGKVSRRVWNIILSMKKDWLSSKHKGK